MAVLRFTYTRTGEESYMNYDGEKSHDNNFSQIYWIKDFVLTDYEDMVSYFNLQSQRLYDSQDVSILVETICISVYDSNKNLKGYIQVAQTYQDEGSESVSSAGIQQYNVISSNGIFNKSLFFQIQFNDDLSRNGTIVIQ
jgi:hypothetical protein